MSDFDLSDFPFAGVGLEYHAPASWLAGYQGADPTIERIIDSRFEFLDYLEFQPSHTIYEPRLLCLSAQMPILLHSSSLSLGSVGIAMDSEFLNLTHRLLKQTQSPWLAEHISWTRFLGGDTQHFVLPTLTPAVAETIVANAHEIRRVTDIPLILENIPRTVALKLSGDLAEGEFISNVVERGKCGFLLDLDSAIITARMQGYDLTQYLRSLPLHRLVEIHSAHPARDWEILSPLLTSFPVKAVTLEWDQTAAASDISLRQMVRVIKAHCADKPLYWHGCAIEASNTTAAARADERIQLSRATSFNISEQSLIIHEHSQDLTLSFPLRFLMPLLHFAQPRTMASALLLPGMLNESEITENLVFLQSLLRAGVLLPSTAMPEREQSAERGKIWGHWSAAWDFYCATRTHIDTPYVSVADLDGKLAQKVIQSQRQPSAFKDYWVHPFYPLPNPLTPTPRADPHQGLLEILQDRVTCRCFQNAPINTEQLSALLYYTWGASSIEENDMGDYFVKKTAPSGGSLHCAEVYPVIMDVPGFAPGIYHYSVRRHGLELISREDPRSWISQACGDQAWIEHAAVVFVSTARLERMAWKYEFSRAWRIVQMDIGHLSQTFSLMATMLGLGCCTTGALRDELFEQKLGLDYRDEPIFLVNGAGLAATS